MRPSIRLILRETNELFQKHFGRLIAPALIAAFAEYWANLGFASVQHRLSHAFATMWLANRSAASLLLAAPVGIARLFAQWAVQWLLWGIAFAATVNIITAIQGGRDSRLPIALRSAAYQRGLPSLLIRLYWRLTLSGYLLMIASAGLGVLIYKFTGPNAFPPQHRILLEVLLFPVLYPPYLLYAARFSLAIPALAISPEAETDPLRASIEKYRSWRAPILIACFTVIVLSAICDQYLPVFISSLSTQKLPYVASRTIWMLVSLATSLLWVWLFVFLTRLYQHAGDEPESRSDVIDSLPDAL